MGYDREPRYLHPYIAGRLQMIIDAINAKLPQGHRAKLVYVHRSPDDQFKLFKQGRVFRNGSWIKVGPVVTHLDGFVKASRHNYIPVAISVACRHGTYSTTSWQLNDRYL